VEFFAHIALGKAAGIQAREAATTMRQSARSSSSIAARLNATLETASGLGLEGQRDAIAAFAKAEGFTITRTFERVEWQRWELLVVFERDWTDRKTCGT
jgi:hypothetical protein